MLIAGFPAGSFQANCYVLAAEPGATCVVVDPGQDAIGGWSRCSPSTSLRPVAVILTHGHLDHTATAAQFCRAVDVPCLHPPRRRVHAGRSAGRAVAGTAGGAGRTAGGRSAAADRAGAAPTWLEPGLAGLPLTIDHTPGHTGGSVVIRLAGDVERPEILLTGDTLFAGSIGRTDLPAGPHPRSSVPSTNGCSAGRIPPWCCPATVRRAPSARKGLATRS